MVNLGADACTLVIQGQDNVSVYRAKLDDGDDAVSPAERRFCRLCSSSLWVWDQRWPDLLHPFASAIDTPLPVPPERTHLMLSSAASWAMPIVKSGDLYFDEYPEESIAQWHDRLGLTSS